MEAIPTETGWKRVSHQGVSHGAQLHDVMKSLLPTPKGSPSGPDYARINREGSGGDDLATAMAKMLPTPDSRCWKSGVGRKENGHSPQLEAVVECGTKTGTPLRLEPAFVEWMMGFPPGWVDLKDGE